MESRKIFSLSLHLMEVDVCTTSLRSLSLKLNRPPLCLPFAVFKTLSGAGERKARRNGEELPMFKLKAAVEGC